MVVCSRASNEEIYETFQRKKQHLKSFAIRGGLPLAGVCVWTLEGVEGLNISMWVSCK